MTLTVIQTLMTQAGHPEIGFDVTSLETGRTAKVLYKAPTGEFCVQRADNGKVCLVKGDADRYAPADEAILGNATRRTEIVELLAVVNADIATLTAEWNELTNELAGLGN